MHRGMCEVYILTIKDLLVIKCLIISYTSEFIFQSDHLRSFCDWIQPFLKARIYLDSSPLFSWNGLQQLISSQTILPSV